MDTARKLINVAKIAAMSDADSNIRDRVLLAAARCSQLPRLMPSRR